MMLCWDSREVDKPARIGNVTVWRICAALRASRNWIIWFMVYEPSLIICNGQDVTSGPYLGNIDHMKRVFFFVILNSNLCSINLCIIQKPRCPPNGKDGFWEIAFCKIQESNCIYQNSIISRSSSQCNNCYISARELPSGFAVALTGPGIMSALSQRGKYIFDERI